MPWETKFNIEETLEKALKAFWQYGYNGTSMRDLTRCMGINSGSIYRTFGNKRTLFLSALDYYNTISVKRLREYQQMDSSRAGIICFFEHIRDMSLDGSDIHGCFIVNTTLEMAPHDKEMEALVSKGQNLTRKFFKNLIIKGQQKNEISKTVNATDTGELILSLLVGLRVLTRNNPTKKQFDLIIRNINLVLDS